MAPRFFHSDRVSIAFPFARWKHGQNGTNGVPYSREVARFALFGGRLPKVKVLTADVPISVICVVLIINKKKELLK